MGRIAQTDDALTFDAPPIRLSFRWDGRRWTHELDAGGRTVAASVEWEPGRDDPTRVVSPAFQQLSSQDDKDGCRALLVGQWGQHHCSAVFQVGELAGGVVVEADVAVRSRSPLQALASTYLVHLTSSDLTDAGPSGIVWDLGGPAGGRLRFEPADRPDGPMLRVSLAEAGRRATRVQACAEIVPSTATQRLRYRWSWHPKPGPT